MNYRKLKLVLMILIFTLVTTGFSNSKNNYDIIDEIYSRIHTEEWKALSKEERMEEINLSDEFINNLNANEFTYALLNYPFMTDFLVLDDTKEFPAHLIKDSNLIARFINDIDDPLLLLVDYHNTLDSRQVNQFTPYLVQDEIISKLSKVKSLAKKSSIESIDFLKKLNDSSFHL